MPFASPWAAANAAAFALVRSSAFALHALRAALLPALLALTACGGGGDAATPVAPAGVGFAESAPVPSVTAFVDAAATNQRGDARYATVDTNAGVRVLSGFLDLWEPSTRLVDAGQTAPARDGFPAIAASKWSGIPGDATDGTVKNAAFHSENIGFVVRTTAARTPAQADAAYYDDRLLRRPPRQELQRDRRHGPAHRRLAPGRAPDHHHHQHPRGCRHGAL
ncbi:hypothetical protein SAMN04489711_110148 [Paracidovorax wautersii]|uniref:PBP domain-containing protein n=1 Tax=Paracidovorax wautersii TaxID=1177982 RepID=A0A1I2FHW4_9BURK|nr:hypothetical protein SAMN04489711_110148 [Paracidovorax wautersii]